MSLYALRKLSVYSDVLFASDVLVEMLRLCPGDNMGQRMCMGSVLLHAAEKPKVKGKPKYTAADALYFARVWLDLDV